MPVKMQVSRCREQVFPLCIYEAIRALMKTFFTYPTAGPVKLKKVIQRDNGFTADLQSVLFHFSTLLFQDQGFHYVNLDSRNQFSI